MRQPRSAHGRRASRSSPACSHRAWRRRDVVGEEDQPARFGDEFIDPPGQPADVALRLADLDGAQKMRIGRAAVDGLTARPAGSERLGEGPPQAKRSLIVGKAKLRRPGGDRTRTGSGRCDADRPPAPRDRREGGCGGRRCGSRSRGRAARGRGSRPRRSGGDPARSGLRGRLRCRRSPRAVRFEKGRAVRQRRIGHIVEGEGHDRLGDRDVDGPARGRADGPVDPSPTVPCDEARDRSGAGGGIRHGPRLPSGRAPVPGRPASLAPGDAGRIPRRRTRTRSGCPTEEHALQAGREHPVEPDPQEQTGQAGIVVARLDPTDVAQGRDDEPRQRQRQPGNPVVTAASR